MRTAPDTQRPSRTALTLIMMMAGWAHVLLPGWCSFVFAILYSPHLKKSYTPHVHQIFRPGSHHNRAAVVCSFWGGTNRSLTLREERSFIRLMCCDRIDCDLTSQDQINFHFSVHSLRAVLHNHAGCRSFARHKRSILIVDLLLSSLML